MVYKPGLEPEPGPGLWQAFNLGLAQDFESPSPPKPGPSPGFEPKPGPIHHYAYADKLYPPWSAVIYDFAPSNMNFELTVHFW